MSHQRALSLHHILRNGRTLTVHTHIRRRHHRNVSSNVNYTHGAIATNHRRHNITNKYIINSRRDRDIMIGRCSWSCVQHQQYSSTGSTSIHAEPVPPLLESARALTENEQNDGTTVENTVSEFLSLVERRATSGGDDGGVEPLYHREDLLLSHRFMVQYVSRELADEPLQCVLLCHRLFNALRDEVSELSALCTDGTESEVLDSDTYAQMIEVFSRSGFLEQTFELFEDMKHVCSGGLHTGVESSWEGERMEEAEKGDEGGYDDVEKAEIDDSLDWEEGPLDMVDGVEEDMVEEEVEEEVEVVRKVTKRAEWNEEDLLLEDDEWSTPKEIHIPLFNDQKTYVQLIDACSAMGRPGDVEDIVMFLQRNEIPLTIDTYHAILRGFVLQGMANEALRYYAQMTRADGIRPTVETLLVLLQVFRSAEDERYLQVFEGMTRDGVVPDAVVYRELLQCVCSVSKDLPRAKAVIQQMREQGIEITVDDYFWLLDCCRSSGQAVSEAESIFSEMKQNGIRPNMQTYNKFLQCLSAKGDVQTFKVFEDFKLEPGFKPDVDSYNAILEASIVGKNLERAKMIVSEMRESGVRPNVVSHNLLFDFQYRHSWKPFLKRVRSAPKKSIFTEIMSQITTSSKTVGERMEKWQPAPGRNMETDAFLFDMPDFKEPPPPPQQPSNEASSHDWMGYFADGRDGVGLNQKTSPDLEDAADAEPGMKLDFDALVELLKKDNESSPSQEKDSPVEDEMNEDDLFNQLVEEIEKQMQ